MNPVATPFFFYMLSGSAVIGGLLVITKRNAMHSALGLTLTLLAVAGLNLMLYAPFVACVQIIVFAAGIMVLFLFVIMLVNVEHVPQNEGRRLARGWPLGWAVGCGLLALLVTAFVRGKALFPDRMIALPEASNTQQLAVLIFGESGRIGQYTFAFEISSVLLLVAILGAAVVTSACRWSFGEVRRSAKPSD